MIDARKKLSVKDNADMRTLTKGGIIILNEGVSTLTICIAALYDNGKGVIIAADLMTTAQFPISYEFEREDVEKIVQISESVCVYALISGNVIFANEVIESARKKIIAEGLKGTAEIAEQLRKSYQKIRLNHIIRNELESRGLNLDTYYQNQQKLLAPIVQMIDGQLRGWNPRVEFIVVGKDESSCHIYTVINPGDQACQDSIGYVAIGTGAPHAIYSLIESYRKSLNKDAVLKLIELAKKRSEVAPGVGSETKIVIEECKGE